MTNAWGRRAGALAAVLAVGSVAVPPPAAAQDAGGDTRMRKLEAEVRALQRKVFPGGDATTFAPEITRPAGGAPAPGQPATPPLTDVLARLDALEASLARVTAQVELQGNRIAQLEAGAAGAAPPNAVLVTPDAAPLAGSPLPAADAAPAPLAAPAANLQAMRAAPPATGRTPSDQRLAAVQAVERPQSDDRGEDAYSYGYRLWQAKLFPEAEQQLKLFVQQYPTHPRVSYGRNLLGRAYLDGGEPREAAKWLLQNYQADKAAPRAPDSLLYLAAAMKQLGDNTRACIALGEFASTYASDAGGRLKPDYDATRKGLSCS